ncbi:MAG: hypothetical protein ACRDPY_16865 [Streptosporangiaceae bacterium]
MQAGVVAPAMSLLVLSEAEIRSVLSPRAAIDSQRAAYLAVAGGTVTASGMTSAAELAAESDIVLTATTSRAPVLRGTWLRAGSTVLTVGSYEPGGRKEGGVLIPCLPDRLCRIASRRAD